MNQPKQYFCIFGRQAILDTFQAGKRFDKILLLKNAGGEEIGAIEKQARETDCPVQRVPKEKLEAILQKYSKYKEADNHQGVVGFLSMIDYYSIDDVLHQIYTKGEAPLFVILDGITDVGNFGAIARSAECLGAHALVIPTIGSAQINMEAMNASSGALKKILVCREKNLLQSIQFLKTNGIKIFGAEMKSSTEISKADFSIPCAIVMGAEGYGISKDVMKLCDEKIKIVMSGTTESLNVSVSAGIILYEINKQRNDNG